jgi:hypothetical protein
MSGIGGGTTPLDASPQDLRREAAHAHAWYRNFVGDVFGWGVALRAEWP